MFIDNVHDEIELSEQDTYLRLLEKHIRNVIIANSYKREKL